MYNYKKNDLQLQADTYDEKWVLAVKLQQNFTTINNSSDEGSAGPAEAKVKVKSTPTVLVYIIAPINVFPKKGSGRLTWGIRQFVKRLESDYPRVKMYWQKSPGQF